MLKAANMRILVLISKSCSKNSCIKLVHVAVGQVVIQQLRSFQELDLPLLLFLLLLSLEE